MSTETETIQVPLMSDLVAKGETPEYLYWVGCAGSFDDRAQRITRDFIRLLVQAQVSFAVLGPEETCNGDPAKRAGNEFLFQMQATMNIQLLEQYGVKKILTTCPHCFNTLKNEYPALGGAYEVIHHSTFLQQLLDQGRLRVQGGAFRGKKITYHDSCYLGRANDIYEAPRSVIESLDAEFAEMPRCKSNGLCCGAGGAQMFKEAEQGDKEVYNERTEEALETQAHIVAVACPFCMTMMSDGVKQKDMNEQVEVLDIAEVLARGTGVNS